MTITTRRFYGNKGAEENKYNRNKLNLHMV